MPTYVKSLRNVLDADANTAANNPIGGLYTTQAEAINASDQLFIISEYASRMQAIQEQIFLQSEEVAGGYATASMKDSLGNFPDPVFGLFSAGVQIGFEQPQWGFPTPFPVSSYGIQGGLQSDVGLRHYHHQIQFGLELDGNYYNGPGGFLVIDYMEDAFNSIGTGAAGNGTGTWDQTNISLGNLRGTHKPVTTVGGNTSGLGGVMYNILVGDPLNINFTSTTGQTFGAGDITGYLTDDGSDEQLCQTTSQDVSIGGYSDGI
jgi:hypothetical protein